MSEIIRNAETAKEIRDTRPQGRPMKGMIWVELPDGRYGLFPLTEEERSAREARGRARRKESSGPMPPDELAAQLEDQEYAKAVLMACSSDTLDMMMGLAKNLALDKKRAEIEELEREELAIQERRKQRQEEVERMEAERKNPGK